MAELGGRFELLAADAQRHIVRIRNELLERLPVGGEASVADPLKMENGLRLIGHDHATPHQKGELVSKTEMGLCVGRKHPAQI